MRKSTVSCRFFPKKIAPQQGDGFHRAHGGARRAGPGAAGTHGGIGTTAGAARGARGVAGEVRMEKIETCWVNYDDLTATSL